MYILGVDKSVLSMEGGVLIEGLHSIEVSSIARYIFI